MRILFVCLLLSLGLGACADEMWPPDLPAPLSDDPEARGIMGGKEPASPYLLQPYRPRPHWVWPTTVERGPIGAQPAGSTLDLDSVSRKLNEATPRPPAER